MIPDAATARDRVANLLVEHLGPCDGCKWAPTSADCPRARLISALEPLAAVWLAATTPTSTNAPQTPSWTWQPYLLLLWHGSGLGREPDAVIEGELADQLRASLSWITAQTSRWAVDPDPVEDDADWPYPSDGQLGDWVRDLRQLADRIEDTRP